MLHTKPPFPSDDNRYKALDRTMRKYGYSRDSLIESLHSAQETFGFLEDEVMKFVAQSLRLPLSKVYGVVTFYTHFTLKPQGEHVGVMCTGTACYIKGAGDLMKAIEKIYGVKEGETTKDNRFSLLTARCLGSCGLAPMGVFDGKVAGHLDEPKTIDIIKGMLA